MLLPPALILIHMGRVPAMTMGVRLLRHLEHLLRSVSLSQAAARDWKMGNHYAALLPIFLRQT
jgi:hypothetical protein